jgi:hypothetical protein
MAKWLALPYALMVLIELLLWNHLPILAAVGIAALVYAFAFVIRLRTADKAPLISGADRHQRRLIREALRAGHSADRVTNALIRSARRTAPASIVPATVFFGVLAAAALVLACWPAGIAVSLRVAGALLALTLGWVGTVAIIRVRRMQAFRITAGSDAEVATG